MIAVKEHVAEYLHAHLLDFGDAVQVPHPIANPNRVYLHVVTHKLVELLSHFHLFFLHILLCFVGVLGKVVLVEVLEMFMNRVVSIKEEGSVGWMVIVLVHLQYLRVRESDNAGWAASGVILVRGTLE